MSIYENWLGMAYTKDGGTAPQLWEKYLPLEQAVYEELLITKTNLVEGTVAELSERFHMPVEFVCGFIDGINDCLDEQIDLESLEENSKVKIGFVFENLYKKMVDYKAAHLYDLPQWENVIDAAGRRDLYYEQKKSGTIVKDAQPGRNDPCSCSSGKKYKKCCGS